MSSGTSDTRYLHSAVNQDESSQLIEMYRVYPWRWVMLVIIFFLNLTNGSLWVTFAPIANETVKYYGISLMAVNMLSVSFMIAYIPLGFFSQWLLDSKSFRWGVILGAWLSLIGAWLRYLSTIFKPHTGWLALALLFGGQSLAACGQPFLLNAPPKLANTWFTPQGRATADMVGTIGNIIGIGLGQFIPPFLIAVNNSTNSTKMYMMGEATEPNMGFMLLIFAIPCSVVGILATLGMRESPKTAPCSSANTVATPFLEGLRKLSKNGPYIVVLLTFGIGLGIFNTLSTLLDQIVTPAGFEDSAGIFGGIIVGVGLISAGITAPLLDYLHLYKEIYVIAFLLAAGAFVWFSLILLWMPTFLMISLSLSLLGLASFMILPTALELCVETTYPVAPGWLQHMRLM